MVSTHMKGSHRPNCVESRSERLKEMDETVVRNQPVTQVQPTNLQVPISRLPKPAIAEMTKVRRWNLSCFLFCNSLLCFARPPAIFSAMARVVLNDVGENG